MVVVELQLGLGYSAIEAGAALLPITGMLLLSARAGAAAQCIGPRLPMTVGPLTAVVLGAVDEGHLGVGSGVNNAIARLAGLLGVAVVPAVVGVDLGGSTASGLPGYRAALLVAAGLCAAGGVTALATIRTVRRTLPTVQPGLLQPCHDPCRLEVPAA